MGRAAAGRRSVCRACLCFCRSARVCVLGVGLRLQELCSNPTLSLRGPSSGQAGAGPLLAGAVAEFGDRTPLAQPLPARTPPTKARDEGSGWRMGRKALDSIPQPDARNPELPRLGAEARLGQCSGWLSAAGEPTLFLFERFVTI